MSAFRPVASRHLCGPDARWDRRTSAGSVSPETAWETAWEMTLPQPEYRYVDEARYYAPERVVLMRIGASIATVIPIDDQRPDGLLYRAAKKQFGIAGDGS